MQPHNNLSMEVKKRRSLLEEEATKAAVDHTRAILRNRTLMSNGVSPRVANRTLRRAMKATSMSHNGSISERLGHRNLPSLHETSKATLSPISRVPFLSQPNGLLFSDPYGNSPAANNAPDTLEPFVPPNSRKHSIYNIEREAQEFIHPQKTNEDKTGMEHNASKNMVAKIDTPKNKFGSELTHRVLIENWLSSFNGVEKEQFNSDLLYLETKLARALTMTDSWSTPNRMSTVVACACFDVAISRMTTFRSMLTTIRGILYNSLFQNYKKVGSAPSANLMPKWLVDAVPYFEDQEESTSHIPKIERKIQVLEGQVVSEKNRIKKMQGIVAQWQWGVVRSYFQHWRDKVEVYKNKKRLLASFVSRWQDTGPSPAEVLKEWHHLTIAIKMADARQDQSQFQKKVAAQAEEIVYLKGRLEEYASQMYELLKENQQYSVVLKMLESKILDAEALEQAADKEATPRGGPADTDKWQSIRRLIHDNAPVSCMSDAPSSGSPAILALLEATNQSKSK
uniref:Uncharacterized protein n=1 Tax=Pyramimonas obovata TaxID=1411642 RepID=A0A7S0R2S0_9CHLO|mmetsp:Transcript_24353/g.53146  ORF Transcript_24353/g.53146 Transcript_24353/m.53146 type:complete len:510 (+) Transcript_24353:69-1598(+)